MMSRVKVLAVAFALAAVVVSCSTGPTPRWRYDEVGQPKQYKRYARNIAVNYFTRFRRTAYVEVDKPLENFLGEEQRQWISEHGQPEYRRRPFRSRLNEPVQEWLYLAKNKLVQFVYGHVVYEGEVTDVERTMLRYGYPTGCIISQTEPGVERFTFVYSRPFDLEREVFSFAGGKMIFRQTLR